VKSASCELKASNFPWEEFWELGLFCYMKKHLLRGHGLESKGLYVTNMGCFCQENNHDKRSIFRLDLRDGDAQFVAT
jgi:hypothetical protein